MQNFSSGFALSAQQAAALSAHAASGTVACAQIGFAIAIDADPARVRAAVQRVVERHEILRTRFIKVDAVSQPLQAVAGQARLEWIADTASGARADWDALAAVGFDAGEHDRVLALIGRDGETMHLLLRCASLHLDAASVDALGAQIAAAYAGQGEPSDDDIVQYADYAEWQMQTRAESPQAEVAVGPAQWLGFALQSAPDAAADGSDDELALDLSPALVAALRDQACRCAVDLGDLLLLAWTHVLQAHLGEAAVELDLTVQTRLVELSQAVGRYAHRTALTLALPGATPLRDAAVRVRDAATHAAEMAVVRSGADLRAHGFAFHRHAPAAPALSPVPTRVRLGRAQGALDLVCSERADGVEALFLHDASRYTTAHVRALSEQYLAALEAIAAAAPDARLSDIGLTDAEGRTRLLAFGDGGNAPERSAQHATRLHELFLRQAALTPDAIAVRRESRELTYRQLDESSARLAQRLSARGVAAETRVGVCLANPVDMIVAIVAVLRSGGVYLPLDINYPVDRLRYMLADSGAALLVMDDAQAGRELLDGLVVDVVPLDAADDASEADSERSADADATPDPRNGAYLIYTSGSTGRPKGVLVPHHAIIDSTLARHRYYPEAPSSFLLLSSFSFDSSIAGIFWTLSSGGKLVLSTPEIVHDIELLAQLIAAESISHTLMVPSLYGTLLGSASTGRLASLRAVIVAGEQCPLALVARHRQALPGTSLYNEYGPTETAVWASVEHCASEHDDRVPIGRPIPGARLYLLDADLRPVPLGVVGELFVAGAGVARGYLDRPDLSAERYLPDPHPQREGARMYRTGDLARFLVDGRLEYVGRIDHQVKVRGYRIELGEIEAVLAGHPAVAGCAVTVHETAGERTLYAYLTARSGEAVDALTLHDFMRERLPVHMLPQDYFVLAQLPLSLNGKIDRKALPHPSTLRRASEYAAPQGAFESALGKVWAELLEVERVGRDDNFFKLGGHSLLAMQLISRIREQFLVDVNIKLVFDHPELAPLAQRIQALAEGGRGTADDEEELDVLEL